MFPEVRNRCKSAMNSFAPMAALLGSRNVSLRRRVNLSHSLIMSKLLCNSQIWEKAWHEVEEVSQHNVHARVAKGSQ